jgi:ribosomal protein S21
MSGGDIVSELKRKKNESFEAFMRRVKNAWLRSGRLIQARKIQFFAKEKSKNVRRKLAVNRIKKVSKINYLRKIGRLPEEETFQK